ncbi:MAG: Lrp/AsnC family transcriptional regulator [Nanoarchaeota archaeon]|nr:Lrp/AsnC family transcriptional regulator [Nanoarchaeota archaeon]
MSGVVWADKQKKKKDPVSVSDLLILMNLRTDARQELSELYKNTGIPISTLFDKLGIFKNNNIIDRFTVLLDFEKLGFAVRANLIIHADPKESEQLGRFLNAYGNVNNLWKINHGHDYMAEIILKNMSDINSFTEQLIKKFKTVKIQSYYIVQDVKREGFLNDNFSKEQLFRKFSGF